MTETPDPEVPESAPAFDPEKDRRRLKGIAAIHLVMVMGAITLWGAADAWAVASGWGLAWVVAMTNAVIAAYVVSSTLHEWGHYTGARLAGAYAPVAKQPIRYFFFFDFKLDRNDARQFLWMSLGGILVPWLLVLATASWVPIDNPSRAMLLAVFVAQAVFVSMFEVPVVLRTRAGGDPKQELERQLEAGFRTGRLVGIAAGALVWLAA